MLLLQLLGMLLWIHCIFKVQFLFSLPNDVNHRGRFRDSSTSSDSDVDEMIKKLEMGERVSFCFDTLDF